MNIRISHQFQEGNQAANYFAKLGESAKIEFYENFHGLPKQIKGILQTDRLGLSAIR